MPYPFPADVRRLVDLQLASGAYRSEDELLREALRSLSGEDDDLAALEEAIAELDSDPGQPLVEAFADVRRSVERGAYPR